MIVFFGGGSAPQIAQPPSAAPPAIDTEQLARIRNQRRRGRTTRADLVVNPALALPGSTGSIMLPGLAR